MCSRVLASNSTSRFFSFFVWKLSGATLLVLIKLVTHIAQSGDYFKIYAPCCIVFGHISNNMPFSSKISNIENRMYFFVVKT